MTLDKNLVIDDLHMQTPNRCLANFFSDAYLRKVYYCYGDGYWKANLFSLLMFCVYPEIDNQKAMFDSKAMMQKALTDFSVMIVKRNSSL